MDLQRTLQPKTLLHIKNLEKIIDAHKTKASSLKTRKQWLDMQKKLITAMNTNVFVV